MNPSLCCHLDDSGDVGRGKNKISVGMFLDLLSEHHALLMILPYVLCRLFFVVFLSDSNRFCYENLLNYMKSVGFYACCFGCWSNSCGVWDFESERKIPTNFIEKPNQWGCGQVVAAYLVYLRISSLIRSSRHFIITKFHCMKICGAFVRFAICE